MNNLLPASFSQDKITPRAHWLAANVLCHAGFQSGFRKRTLAFKSSHNSIIVLQIEAGDLHSAVLIYLVPGRKSEGNVHAGGEEQINPLQAANCFSCLTNYGGNDEAI